MLLLSMISNGLEKGGNSVVAILTQLSFVAQRHFPIFAEFFKLKTGEGEKLLHNLIALSDPLEDEAISTAAQLVSDQIRTGLQESKYDDLRSSLLCSLSRLIPELVLGKGMNMISSVLPSRDEAI